MGQRHNRRRTRPRSRNRNTTLLNAEVTSLPISPCVSTSSPAFDCHESPLASARHYEWLTWHAQYRTLRPEAIRLETEQCRLFGGEPGDDVDLCYRMLTFFDGLDYIDPSQAMLPLPG